MNLLEDGNRAKKLIHGCPRSWGVMKEVGGREEGRRRMYEEGWHKQEEEE
jgi:hypothetical protein